jgi:mannitol/fructose-specific phosphotransferase system IIA component (Ntr-type)
VNALTARLAREVFLVPSVHVVNSGADAAGHSALAAHLRSTILFGRAVDLRAWNYHVEHEEATLTEIPIEPDSTSSDVHRLIGGISPALTLAVRRNNEYAPFHNEIDPSEADAIVVLQGIEQLSPEMVRFERLLRAAPALDIEHAIDASQFFDLAAESLAGEIGMSEADLAARFMARESAGSTVILPGIAVPHVGIEGKNRFAFLLARCREGITFPEQPEPVNTVFVLAGTPDERNFHLRSLAAIANIVQSPDFESAWIAAPDSEALRAVVLHFRRRRLTGGS